MTDDLAEPAAGPCVDGAALPRVSVSIRQGIQLAAMANRVWDEPLFSRTFEGPGRTPSRAEVRDTVADAVRREAGSDSGTAA